MSADWELVLSGSCVALSNFFVAEKCLKLVGGLASDAYGGSKNPLFPSFLLPSSSLFLPSVAHNSIIL